MCRKYQMKKHVQCGFICIYVLVIVSDTSDSFIATFQMKNKLLNTIVFYSLTIATITSTLLEKRNKLNNTHKVFILFFTIHYFKNNNSNEKFEFLQTAKKIFWKAEKQGKLVGQKNNNIKPSHIYNYCLSLSGYCCVCFQHDCGEK